MDVNGTKFHLLYGLDDWGRCLPQDAVSSGVSAQTLLERLALPDAQDAPAFDWHAATRSLRLARQTVIFRRSKRSDPLPLSWRRGAGRDQYGHWYWIDEDETGIRFLAYGEQESVTFWDSTELPTECELPDNGDFVSCPPLGPSPLLLRGLAVTADHYLVVGNVTERGLLIFDLHRGGPPMLMTWPEDVPFVPWDIAATPDGGVLILDRDNLHYWVLDHNFRLAGEVTEEEALFQPEVPPGDPEPPRLIEQRAVRPLGYSLTAGADTPPTAPISIEPGPEGRVLILDAADEESSLIFEYDEEDVFALYSLADAVNVFSEDEDGTELFSVNAHDFAYVECCTEGGDDCAPCLDLEAAASGPARTLRLIFVAERDGDQVLAFEMRTDPDSGEMFLDAQPDFLPLRRWEGKGLVTAANEAYYDFSGRWVPLSVFIDCRYATRGVLWTPIDFEPGLPEQPFDSNLPGCEWHRLLLDASIPAGTAVFVRARAADDLALLEQAKWIVQPRPYLRSGDAELPFYDTRLSEDPAQRAGTWELLFQAVQGRYLQLELTLEGTGRSTPVIYALRAWYPRFSYLHNYLPVIYREEPVHASFLDRWLANYEGFYTNIEDMIDHLPRLLDPRSTPHEALDWLASWLGLVMDPLWAEDRRRFFIQYAHELFKWRGTVRGLVMVLRVYLDNVLDPTIFDPAQYDISFLDDSVRIVENFLTRGGLSLQYGDASGGSQVISLDIDLDVVQANAHRFTVLVPHCLTDEQVGMVERIIELEKPAHTAFVLNRYWDLFRVGEARLGLDTQLGTSSAFSPIVLGESHLPEGYLQPPYPYDIGNRVVLTRDRLGDYPEL